MQLAAYFNIIWRRKWLVLLVTVLTVGIVAAASMRATPTYSASTEVRVAMLPGNWASYLTISHAERVMSTYAEVLTYRTYMQKVIDRLDLPMSADTLYYMIDVNVIPNTELISISTESKSAQQAADIANALAEILIEEGQQVFLGTGKSTREVLQEELRSVEVSLLEDRGKLEEIKAAGVVTRTLPQIDDLETRIASEEQVYKVLQEELDNRRLQEAMLANTISVVQEAVPARHPSSPKVNLNVALALASGLGVGVALAFVIDNIDRRIHSVDVLASVSGLPVLGTVPVLPGGRREEKPRLLGGDGRSAGDEAFRLLRSVLLPHVSGSFRKSVSLLVTSAEPGVGKSTILVNLATKFAQVGKKVIVVDSDLRHPALHGCLALTNTVGLTNVVLQPTLIDSALQETSVRGMLALTSGPLPRFPGELLSSGNMRVVIDALKSRADLVLFDSPPVLSVADAAGLAPSVDGVVLVVGKGATTDRALRAAINELGDVGAEIEGAILNRGNSVRYEYLAGTEIAPRKGRQDG